MTLLDLGFRWGVAIGVWLVLMMPTALLLGWWLRDTPLAAANRQYRRRGR